MEVKRVPVETALQRHGCTGGAGKQPQQVSTAAASGLGLCAKELWWSNKPYRHKGVLDAQD